jgi:hypothetical protein
MLVICNGMPRSASTWAFNVAVELLRRSEPGAELHSGYDESVARFLASAPPTATHIVVKCHELDARGRALAQGAAARTIYTWRDPADAVVSCMRMFGYDFERSLAAIESSLKLYLLYRRWGTALIMSYREVVEAPVEAVERIATYLGVESPSDVVSTVANETSLERMKEKVKQLESADEAHLAQTGSVAYDPETLLHPGHVRDGGFGYGREALTAEQLAQCEALLLRYVQHPRRAYALQRLALVWRVLRQRQFGRVGSLLRDAVFGKRRSDDDASNPSRS